MVLVGDVELLYVFAHFGLVLLIAQRCILKSPTIIVGLCVFPFSSLVFFFTYFSALLFDAYPFGIAMFSLCIDSFTLYDPLCL